MKNAKTAFFFVFTLILSPAVASAIEISSPTLSTQAIGVPLYVYIPSIKLMSLVQSVGIDDKGRMDVPSEKTNNVGWYKYGVAPGNSGTAVLDAHVTAAFRNLEKVPVGGEIYVYNSNGTWLKFVVNKAKVYDVKTTHPLVLFEPTRNKQINLITCAGTLLGGGEATHRLIVSAQLAA